MTKRYVLRVDLNVPITKDRNQEIKISSTKRIEAVMPGINKILSDPEFDRLVIVSHFDRPKGSYNPEMTLRVVYQYMKQLIPGLNFVPYLPNYSEFFDSIGARGIYLLDNIRFYSEEEGLDEDFSRSLANLGDLFIMDAFATIHRGHSSTVGVKRFSDVEFKYGDTVIREIDSFNLILDGDNSKTKLAILGGAKVSDKIKLLDNLIDTVNQIIIGGGMAFTFLKVLHGIEIGDSLFDDQGIETVRSVHKKCIEKGVSLHLPVDAMINDAFSNTGNIKVIDFTQETIPSGSMGLDIGPKTIEMFKDVIDRSDVLVWNGPMGVFEFPMFEKGSVSLLNHISNKTIENKLISIIGGGDTGFMCEKFNSSDMMTFVSTGGGASLKLLGGELSL